MNSTEAIKTAYVGAVNDMCLQHGIVSPFRNKACEGKRATVTYIADLGILGEVMCEAHYILERDDAGLYPAILQLIVRDTNCGLYGRDIYGDHITDAVEADLIELAKDKEGLE